MAIQRKAPYAFWEQGRQIHFLKSALNFFSTSNCTFSGVSFSKTTSSSCRERYAKETKEDEF